MREPKFILKMGGNDVSSTWGKRLISASVKDAAGWEKDSLNLSFNNAGNALELPFPETEIAFSLGYADGEMRDFGLFFADSVKQTFPQNVISIAAKASQIGAGSSSANMEKMKERVTREWTLPKTLKECASQIAHECGLELKLGESLNTVDLPPECATQNNETFFAFLNRVAKVLKFTLKLNSGTLLAYSATDADAFAGDPVELNESEISSATFDVKRSDAYKSIAAKWHDVETAQLYTETVGDGSPVFEIKEEFSSKESAKAAAERELAEKTKKTKTCNITAAAKMSVCAEGFITLTGENLNALSAGKWRVSDVSFTLDKSGVKMTVNGEFTNAKPQDQESLQQSQS